MNLYYLKRNYIAKFYGYHSKNNINDKETATNYLSEITTYLNKYFYESNNDFVMIGRKKFVYDEVMDILDGNKKVENPIYFVLGSLEEFMCNNNFISFGGMSGEDFAKMRDKMRSI